MKFNTPLYKSYHDFVCILFDAVFSSQIENKIYDVIKLKIDKQE